VISYNPGYQSVLKDLKPSTRQRFVALDFDFPAPEHEAAIVVQPSYGLSDSEIARMLKESIAHANDDMAARALAEAKFRREPAILRYEAHYRAVLAAATREVS